MEWKDKKITVTLKNLVKSDYIWWLRSVFTIYNFLAKDTGTVWHVFFKT